jgi:hypothetical protein
MSVDFVAVCISILLWLVRPQDWVAGLSGIGFMTYAMLAAFYGLYQRPGSITKQQFTQSPTDYLVIAYLVWTIWTTGSWFELTKAMIPFAAFYFVTALSLNTAERLNRFLACWVIGLSVTMGLTLCSVHGFEIVAGTEDLTEQFLGRLALNTWIYNNPNSLGHGIVALISASYVWFIWKRSGAIRLAGIAIIAGAAEVTYLTQSKGAYLCGAAAITASMIFRRRKVVQIFTLVCVMTAGVGALKLLPRMEELNNNEAGIAGRLMIWQMAYNAMANTKTGEGWKKFEAWIDTEDYGLIHKATHGSYVNVGADLGYVGLMLFVGILYCNFRTLLQAKVDPEHVNLERCQRLLLSLVVSYTASAWMIDRAYHTDYFILAGAIAAFHRLMVLPAEIQIKTEQKSDLFSAVNAFQGLSAMTELKPQLKGPTQSMSLSLNSMTLPETAFSRIRVSDGVDSARIVQKRDEENEDRLTFGLQWRHLQWIDLVSIVILLIIVTSLWHYLMTSFISF